MPTCSLCLKPTDAGPNNGYRHNACIDEQDRRLKSGTCCFCGEEPIDRHNEALCENCNEDDSIEPQNYPSSQ